MRLATQLGPCRSTDGRWRVASACSVRADHLDTLISVGNLAYCRETLGDASGALPLYRRALESSERVLGAEHPDTLRSANNLAYGLLAVGDAAGALPLYRRALVSQERTLGTYHPQ